MEAVISLCFVFSMFINKSYGQTSLLQNNTSDKNGLLLSTVTGKVPNMLRDILKRESLERLSMVQRIHHLERKEQGIEAENEIIKKELSRMNETLQQEFRAKNDVYLLAKTLETALGVLNKSSLQWTEISKVPDITGNYSDCLDILRKFPSLQGIDGVFEITIASKPKFVYCDMTTEGGGWTAIQRRQDGSTDFYRTWSEYKQGFGDPSKNYWIGNDAMYELTKNKDQELRVELQRFNGDKAYAQYSTFYVGDEDSKYKLTLSGYSGTAGDSLTSHSGSKFSTKDQDNDRYSQSCATNWHGAWWYHSGCHHSHLNGVYAQSALSDWKYPVWSHWKSTEALQKTAMFIRRS
ncbi:fibrinogen-like protein A [Saccostrea cucullata]|uniref:fibrinogen-like protein A n=1 Tax=Saccostrea cuccullata TaxID=36930 RepID=UPI002ED6A516